MSKEESEYRLPESLKDTILEKIVCARMRELAGAKSRLPAASLEDAMDRAPEVRPLKKALMSHTPAVIAEVKKASPSAGLLREDFDPVKIAAEYKRSGAAALSVLTEVHYFRGGLEVLARLRWNVRIPLLRKDFIVDTYQVLEARHAGADAVLLIAALLDPALLEALRKEAERLGMEALVEVHNEAELHRALDAGATLVGVNSRDLRTFEVSLDVPSRLARLMPQNVLPVAESGIRTGEDLRKLAAAGYKAFLVGEQFMRAPSPGAALSEMIKDSRFQIPDSR